MYGEAVRTRVPVVDVAPIPPIEGRRGRLRWRYAAGCGEEFLVPMLMPVHPPILPCHLLVLSVIASCAFPSRPPLASPPPPLHTHTPTHTPNEPSIPSLSLLRSPVLPLTSIRALLSFLISRISFTLYPICIRNRVVHHFVFAPPMAVFFGLSLFSFACVEKRDGICLPRELIRHPNGPPRLFWSCGAVALPWRFLSSSHRSRRE